MRSIFVAAVLILLVASCGLVDRRQSLTLQSLRGDRVTVTVLNETARAIIVVARAPRDLPSEVGVIRADVDTGDPRVLFLTWMMTPCEDAATLRVREVEVRLRLELEPNDAAACEAIGITYGLELRFAQVPDPQSIDVVVLRAGETLRESPHR